MTDDSPSPRRNGAARAANIRLGRGTDGRAPMAKIIAKLEASVAKDPENAGLRVNLGRMLLAARDDAAAKAAFTRCLDIDPNNAQAHYFLAKVHRRARDMGAAKNSYAAAIAANPDFSVAHADLADLLYRNFKATARAEDLAEAAVHAIRAVELGPPRLAHYLLAGKILIDSEKCGDALTYLEKALDFPKKHPDLYVALSCAYRSCGDAKKAQEISRRLTREFPTAIRLCPRPEAQVLVLEVLNNGAFVRPHYGSHAYAQTNTIASLAPDRVSLHHTFIHDLTPSMVATFRGRYGVIYNNVANSEINALRGYTEALRKICDLANLPVVNSPENIALATRDSNYRRLSGIENLVFPKTLRLDVDPAKPEPIVERLKAEFEFPVLLRRYGPHRAGGIEFAGDPEQARDIVRKFRPGPMYAIQFLESRHPSGNYMRYRGVFVGGHFFPARLYLSETWLISGPIQRILDKTVIGDSPDFQREERAWLGDPKATLGAKNFEALHELDRVLGLDCYGCDFGVGADGRVIVFEANSCMNTLSMYFHVKKFPYLAMPVNNIKVAIEDLLIAKAKGN